MLILAAPPRSGDGCTGVVAAVDTPDQDSPAQMFVGVVDIVVDENVGSAVKALVAGITPRPEYNTDLCHFGECVDLLLALQLVSVATIR